MRRSLSWLLALALLGGAVVWWIARERPASEPGIVATPQQVSADAHASTRAGPDPVLAPATEHADREAVAESAAAAADSFPRIDPEQAIWFSGRVAIPPGTPADERMQLVVTERGRPVARVDVDTTGGFRIPVDKELKRPVIGLDARYLFLEDTIKLDLARPDSPIVVEPVLGACLRGRLRAPEDGVGIEATIELFTGISNRKCITDAQGRFEIGGLDPQIQVSIVCDDPRFLPLTVSRLRLSAGVALDLDLLFEPGVRAIGRVVDDAGGPVEGASIEAWIGEAGRAQRSQRTAQSSRDGTFLLQGLAGGRLVLGASLDGFVGFRTEPYRMQEGGSLRDIVLALSRGNALEGFVRWPDGKPVVGGTVRIEPLPRPELRRLAEDLRPNKGEQKTDSEGHFRITGLGEGPFRVSASSKPELEAVDSEGSASPAAQRRAERARSKLADWTAEIEDVPANSRALVLTLPRPLVVQGTVRDDRGRPLDSFTIRATQRRASKWPADAQEEQRFSGADGSFAMQRLRAGKWDIAVDARGHASPPSSPIELSRDSDSPQLHFVCPRAVRVSGRVLDPTGAPVAQAQVSFASPEHWRAAPNLTWTTRTDKDGVFELRGIPPGLIRLSASHASFAGSGPRELELAPGAVRDPFDIYLTVPAELEVYAAGSGLTDETLVWLREPSGNFSRGKSAFGASPEIAGGGAREGPVRIRGLEPGTYWVAAAGGDRVSANDVSVTVGRGEVHKVELELVIGGRVRVTLVDESGESLPFRASALDARGIAAPRSNRVVGPADVGVELGPLSPGTWTIVAEFKDGRSARKEVRVVGGESTALELRLEN